MLVFSIKKSIKFKTCYKFLYFCVKFSEVVDGNNSISFLSDKFKIFGHSIFWLIYIGLALFHMHYSTGFGGKYAIILVGLIDAVSIYFIVAFMMPRLLEKQTHYARFVMFFILVIVCNFLLNFLMQNFLFSSFDGCPHNCILKQSYSFQHSLVFIVMASGIKLFKINLDSVELISRLEKKKIQSELEYLKLQINPHFLFNTLNNIYIQSRIQPKEAGETLLKLSDLLRYQIYDCADKKVFLKSEIEFLKNYLDLHKIRFSKLSCTIEQKGNIAGLMIYPFILITFVDNAMKKSADLNTEGSFVNLNFEIVDNKIKFFVESSKNMSILQKKSIVYEDGLDKVKERMDLLYSGNHKLNIEESENKYIVKLEINLE